jgi:hypothetical protein
VSRPAGGNEAGDAATLIMERTVRDRMVGSNTLQKPQAYVQLRQPRIANGRYSRPYGFGRRRALRRRT